LVVPTPQGEVLKSYGWRESNSCTRDSSFFDTYHPALVSLTKVNANVGVDGYFSSIPAGSTVLLRATANKNPVLISYKYGQGTVILTSMYSDWAYSHSQASRTELNLVRDLITFAKNVDLSISSYNITNNPNATITLPVTIKNDTQLTASKVQIVVYTRIGILFFLKPSRGFPWLPGQRTRSR